MAKENGTQRPRARKRRYKLDLVGTAEAAAILGVERPRIGRWRRKGLMPELAAEVSATPLWFRDDIEGMRPWVDSRRRSKAAA